MANRVDVGFDVSLFEIMQDRSVIDADPEITQALVDTLHPNEDSLVYLDFVHSDILRSDNVFGATYELKDTTPNSFTDEYFRARISALPSGIYDAYIAVGVGDDYEHEAGGAIRRLLRAERAKRKGYVKKAGKQRRLDDINKTVAHELQHACDAADGSFYQTGIRALPSALGEIFDRCGDNSSIIAELGNQAFILASRSTRHPLISILRAANVVNKPTIERFVEHSTYIGSLICYLADPSELKAHYAERLHKKYPVITIEALSQPDVIL